MGKPKWKKSSSSRGSGSLRDAKSSSPSLANVITVEKTLEKIQTYIESCDFMLAEKFAIRGIERFPENPEVLEVAAQCFTEVGAIQKARACYQKAISISPLKGWRKYLGLAQLCDGRDALLQYSKGIEVMERQIADRATGKDKPTAQVPFPAPDAMETASSSSDMASDTAAPVEDVEKNADIPSARDLSNAHLAISELYTTDLCDEENAEEFCKYSTEKAMLADPKNPEPFLQMANFHLIKGDKEAAKQFVKGGLSLWYKNGKVATAVHRKPDGDARPAKAGSDENASEADDEESGIPPLSFQIETAKALIECEEYVLSSKLFMEFIGQNPTDPELWFLCGLSHFLGGQEHYSQARSDFKKAKRFSTTPHGVCYDIIAQCDEHLATINTALPPGDDDGDSDDEEEAGQGKVKEEHASAATGAGMSEEADEQAGSEWETDEEEEGPGGDVEMS